MKALSHLLDSAKLIDPNPVSLVCSKTPSGITNLATVSWWTYLSLDPATIGFAMMKPSYTGEMVRTNKKSYSLFQVIKYHQNRLCSVAALQAEQKKR